MIERTGLRAQRLGFRLRALDEIDLGRSPGSALRGALAAALAEGVPHNALADRPDHWRRCAVCLLLSGIDPRWPRGRHLPRPYAIEPGLPRVTKGESWTFSLTLIGPVIALHQTVSDAVALGAARGIGRGRGRSAVEEVRWLPVIGDDGATFADDETVTSFRPRVTRVAIAFRTPLRLTDRGALVRKPNLLVLVQRLLERMEALSALYGDDPPPAAVWAERRTTILPIAAAAVLERDATFWRDSWSGSRRTGAMTPIGGLIGEATWRGEVTPLIPWLRWGAVVHLGKNTVKGDGWIALDFEESSAPPLRRGAEPR